MNKMLSFYKIFYSFVANKFSHFYDSTVISVVEVDYDGYVYNLSIDGDETYIADGIVVHNCRSSRIPITKSWKELGFDNLDEDESLSNRPFVADTRSVKDIPKSQRDSVIGTTSARTYSEFAANQPLSFMQDVAGSYRGELAKKGTLPLSALVRNGQWMTIEQIEASESKAIKGAIKKAFG